MKDCIGQKLFPGDRVAVQNKRFKKLSIMYVHSYTPKNIRVTSELGADMAENSYNRIVAPYRVVKVYLQEI